MDTFKVGDHFERINSRPYTDSCPKGYRGIVKRVNLDVNNIYDQNDIIHEFRNIKKIDPPINSPVKTICERKIVPGSYGDIEINEVGMIYVTIDGIIFYSEDLRETAQMFIEMAEVLEENSKDKD